jgi:hypothetical protein
VIIVGSEAAVFWNLVSRDPKDIDLWVCEGGEYPLENRSYDISVMPRHIYNLLETCTHYATADTLYTIKCSHLGWPNPNWSKHKSDILVFKKKGCKILPDLYTELVKHWSKELSNKSFLSLDTSKEKFFTDKVIYKYDHDKLHELVAYPNKPVYTKCLREGCEVLIDQNKFNLMPFDSRVKMFREEIVVIALERWYLTDYWEGINFQVAWRLALQKTITSLTKLWATDFIIQNLLHFIKADKAVFDKITLILELKETKMLKVCMNDINKLKETVSHVDSLQDFVYSLCEGGLYVSTGLAYPKAGVRAYNNEEYQKEVREFRAESAKINSKILKDVEYTHLQQEGGGEGGSEDCFGVFSLNGIIYKAEYSYFSYDGHNYDDILSTLKVVEAKEKTITVYN